MNPTQKSTEDQRSGLRKGVELTAAEATWLTLELWLLAAIAWGVAARILEHFMGWSHGVAMATGMLLYFCLTFPVLRVQARRSGVRLVALRYFAGMITAAALLALVLERL